MNTEFLVETSENLLRLDLFLAKRFPDISRAEWKRRIQNNEVLVNQKRCNKSDSVCEGQIIKILCPNSLIPNSIQPNPTLNIQVLFQDAHIIAVNKSPNTPSHPLQLSETNTTANGIAAIAPEFAHIGTNAREGGLVHRLDNQTSGVLIAAKTSEAYEKLRTEISDANSIKEYLAIVIGEVPSPFDVHFPISHHSTVPKKMVAVGSDSDDSLQKSHRGTPREAHSRVTIMEKFPNHTLVSVKISQGQRHQIRVHLAAAGFPICADTLYQSASNRVQDQSKMERHALHSFHTTFKHPITGEQLSIQAPLPADFVASLQHLRLLQHLPSP